jgi:hypothetical protein
MCGGRPRRLGRPGGLEGLCVSLLTLTRCGMVTRGFTGPVDEPGQPRVETYPFRGLEELCEHLSDEGMPNAHRAALADREPAL